MGTIQPHSLESHELYSHSPSSLLKIFLLS
jgi:hypothetical protein